MEWYLAVLKKYFDFNGRARRKEFWMFFLFNAIISIVLSVLTNITGKTVGPLFTGLSALYSLAILLPTIGVTVRRLHDIGKSGWWALLYFFVCIGQIWLIVLLAKEGDRGDNQYGPDPKAASF